MDLNLIDQQNIRDQIAPKLAQLKAEMDKRKPVWESWTLEQREQHLQKAIVDDPVVDIAWDMCQYLYSFFREEIGNVLP